ncbi:hypothetical protein BU24DRAFT_23801 [Aaosphaeria arxii CBS 175.79]|uniref:Uncharacterized protein n=1 Tax=Aaosphaeria arxii CBS 175.79 TaxID=1450172 RepID=A0A6A5YA33_9PLEO|nr:uncharacterized protein BU24DRAFT_23801 [Aaosphaeria arxii CBS 175.79]KAF2021611.1 hypothetical protein BU24DRAFT_23801 [Aaosphaeria arxii CBS 175.79]
MSITPLTKPTRPLNQATFYPVTPVSPRYCMRQKLPSLTFMSIAGLNCFSLLQHGTYTLSDQHIPVKRQRHITTIVSIVSKSSMLIPNLIENSCVAISSTYLICQLPLWSSHSASQTSATFVIHANSIGRLTSGAARPPLVLKSHGDCVNFEEGDRRSEPWYYLALNLYFSGPRSPRSIFVTFRALGNTDSTI